MRMFTARAATMATLALLFCIGGCCSFCKVSTRLGDCKWLEMDKFASHLRAEECGSTYYWAIGTPSPDQFPKDCSLFVGTDRSCCLYMISRPAGAHAAVAVHQRGRKLADDFYTVYYAPKVTLLPGMSTLVSASGKVWTFYYRRTTMGFERVRPEGLQDVNFGGEYELAVIYPKTPEYNEGADVPVMVEREFGDVVRQAAADYKREHPEMQTGPATSSPVR